MAEQVQKMEYRVVIQREGCRKKIKRFATRKAAERLLRLVTSDEPWAILHPDMSPDARYHCGGCSGCSGWRGSLKEHELEVRANLPPLISAHVEARQVGEWVAEEANVEVRHG